MAERRSPQALPDPNLEPNDSDQKPQDANQTQRLTESPSAAEPQCGELRSSGERRTESNLETLGAAGTSSVQTLAVHHHRSDDLHGSSAASNSSGKAESKETDAPPEKEIIQGEAQPLPTQTNRLQLSVCSTPLSELPPTSVIQSSPSVSSPSVPKQKLSTPKVNNARLPEVDKKSSSGGKTLSVVSVARSSASDGYNWRKYGQKQVKSPTGSRSYYRCTHSDCCAKKIECCDHSGHVIEIVYKSEHSHDPPRKINSLRENKILSASEPIVEKSVPDQPVRLLKGPDPSISSKESLQEAPCSTDKKRPNSSSISNGKVILKEEPVNEPELKKRMKKGDLTDMDSPVKPGKKPKFVTEHGLAPLSWTDYLYLTVGGTLSNAGISGQTFRFGPQISTVREMDVITGKGESVTCSSQTNSELFHAVLGGLGQFGIITRARIALAPAPKRVKWVRLLYNEFSAFTKDQEQLISITGRKQNIAVDYVEGSLLMHQGPINNWRSSFFPLADHGRIISLVTQHSVLYCLEIAKYYDGQSENNVDKELQVLLQELSYIPGFYYEKDVSYVEFLNRVRSGELKLQSQGLWDVPHPWLNLFIPKSQIMDFDSGVFKNIILKRNITTGPVLVYPMNRNKWDNRMSASIPDEDIFYTVGFLHSSGFDNWKDYDTQNKEIVQFCNDAGINIKQYLPHYRTQEDWTKHFGPKWRTFVERKQQFDPRMILSPGQRIFNN